MNDFKSLSNAEKLAEIGKCNFRRGEIALIEEYMLALADDNRAVIDEYESFGDWPNQIIDNKTRYIQAASVYGFTEKHFNEHGWIGCFTFTDCETVIFEVVSRIFRTFGSRQVASVLALP